MKTSHTTVVAILACLFASSVPALIRDSRSLDIDFTNSADAKAKATWSEPDKVTITTNGLGSDGEAASWPPYGWMQTIPLALRLSWRPPSAISVRVSIHPKPTKISDAGDVYVRYSPDLKHWSTWQVLQRSEPQSDTEKQTPGQYFSGIIRVPYAEREQYEKLVSHYAMLDVPWQSDEDAAVRWILEKQPEFFAKHLPFIGYVEFRYEGTLYGGQRLGSFNADVSYGLSGMHSQPKDKDIRYDRGSKPWSFRAQEEEQKAEPRAGADGAPPAQP